MFFILIISIAEALYAPMINVFTFNFTKPGREGTFLTLTAAPVYFSEHANGAHEWLIEFEKAPENLQQFIIELDQALKNCNSDYEAKRHKDIALRLPIVHILPNGHFTKWLHSKNKVGGQHKVPRLSNERVILEEILSIQ